jgi:hypothetical protein
VSPLSNRHSSPQTQEEDQTPSTQAETHTHTHTKQQTEHSKQTKPAQKKERRTHTNIVATHTRSEAQNESLYGRKNRTKQAKKINITYTPHHSASSQVASKARQRLTYSFPQTPSRGHASDGTLVRGGLLACGALFLQQLLLEQHLGAGEVGEVGDHQEVLHHIVEHLLKLRRLDLVPPW